METTNIVDFARRDGITDALTELLKTGAQQLIATAVQAELESFMAHFKAERTEAGHAAVVRNGHHPASATSRISVLRGRRECPIFCV